MPTAQADIDTSRAATRSDIESQIAEQRALNKREEDLLSKQIEEKKPLYEGLRKADEDLSKVSAQAPRLKPIPEAPRSEEMLRPSSLQKTFGLASIFALLAVGAAKGSGIGALQALGGFMKGAREGNVERAHAAIQDFNNNMEQTIQTNEQALKEYNLIVGNKKLSLDAQERMLKMKMYEHQDQMGVFELEQKGMKSIHDLINQRAKMDHEMQMELLRTRQIESQIAHQRAIENKKLAADKAALKATDIAKIEDQARLEVSAALPRDQLGQIILGPEWGKTMDERIGKFAKFVDDRKREIARQRGMPGLFDKEPLAPGDAAPGQDPEMMLRTAISNGSVKKDTGAAMKFLTDRGVSRTQAAAIIQKVAREPEIQY